MSNAIARTAATARLAARQLATVSGPARNHALGCVAQALSARRDEIMAANAADVEVAKNLVAAGNLSPPLLKRLDLRDLKFDGLIDTVKSVQAQTDPLGETRSAIELDLGLNLFKVSVPIGVVGVIFESRPDALVQIACLCLKSGNAVLLKGGHEAKESNRILAEVISSASRVTPSIPEGWISLLESREQVGAMLDQDRNIDLIVPRGGNDLVQHIMNNTNIPVMGHADGICHCYIDRSADIDKALRIVLDAKTQYVSACNATETLLVHQDVAANFLTIAVPQLVEHQVELRGDSRSRSMVSNYPLAHATDEDWRTEYLDYILAIRIVDDLTEAVDHINRYGSHHTDAIITEDRQTALTFLSAVDSASVLHNASTRFADGYRYGLGAEVGISTNRLHSRGPVGLEGLTTYKYILEGNGHIVGDYEGQTCRSYVHRRLDRAWRAT